MADFLNTGAMLYLNFHIVVWICMTCSLAVHTVDILWLVNHHQKGAKNTSIKWSSRIWLSITFTTIHSQYINVTITVKCKYTTHYHTIRKHTFTLGTKFIIFAVREMTCPFLSLKRGNNVSFLPIQSRQILLKFNAIIRNVNKYHYP